MPKSHAIAKAPAPATEAQPSDKPSGPRSSKGVRTRERLVEAAKEIFEEHGFLEARITDIAERAGQSHGSFYYYFDSKEEIFREVAAIVDDRLFAPMDEVIMAQSRLRPQQRVREAMRRYFESYRKEARIMGLIEHVSRIDPERAKLADPKLDPMVTAAALGALTYRFAEMWLVHEAVDCTLDHAVEQVSRIFANAIRLKEG